MTTLRYRYPKGHRRGPSGWLTIEIEPDEPRGAIELAFELDGIEIDRPATPRQPRLTPSPGDALPGQVGLFGGAR